MLRISIKRVPMTAEQSLLTLKRRGILTNRYAEKYISHPCFSAGGPEEMTAAIISLEELGLERGASFDELLRHIKETQFGPCPPDTGFFLRLAWTNQPQSQNSILTGTHSSPNQAVTVLSELLEQDDAFPKGLYLRKVDGKLWLRGFVCDSAYRFPGDALFALEMRRT
ncbi:MAG: hypothetical protein J6P58_08915 [Oscillospiraceae bacterium]|nr:hypothetical protein [Oscillospiraceae bacterium]